MSLIKYLSNLMPILSKGAILEDMRLAHTTFSDCLDAYKRAVDKVPGKFEDASVNELSKQYASLARTGSGKNILVNVLDAIPEVLRSIELLETIVSGELQETEASQGLDYKKANLVQLADALNFASRFTVKVLSFASSRELNAVRLKNGLEPNPISELDDYEAKKLQENMAAYASVMRIMSATKEVSEKIAKIPDVLASGDNFGMLKNTIGKGSIEPFDFAQGKSLNWSWSPMYLAGIAKANIKHARAEEAKAELSIVRIRLYQMENAARGREDAATQQQISMLKSKCNRLTRDIEKAEM